MISLIVSLLITAACLYYGILYENVAIITMGYALGLGLVLSVFEVVYRYVTIRCSLEIPIAVAERDVPANIVFHLSNRGILPSGRVDVYMKVRSTLRQRRESMHFAVPQLPRKDSCYHIPLVFKSAGSHEVELIRLRIYSTLGLCSLRKRCRDYGSVLVLPEIHPVGIQVSEGTRHFMGDAEVYDEIRMGNIPGDSSDVREYRPKDKLQSIHWKLSARMDELMVREYSHPKACAIVLLPDLQLKKGIRCKNAEAFLELVTSISFVLMDGKTPHFVAWMSRETGQIRRARVDDEESFYLSLVYYLQDADWYQNKNLRQEYRERYRNEYYLHDVQVDSQLRLLLDGECVASMDRVRIKDECEKLELLL